MNRSTVFIPLVSPLATACNTSSTVEGRFIEVYAESYRMGADSDDLSPDDATIRQAHADYDRKALDKYWDRVAAPLRINSPTLYQSGCVAANALRKLQFKRRFAALYQYFKPGAVIESKRLHAVSAWGPTEGHSAELGLALALASTICQVQKNLIVATGSLVSTTQTGIAMPQLRADDVKVYPVASLPRKLRLLIAEIESGYFQAVAKHRTFWLITPRLFESEGDYQPVNTLSEFKILQSLGVKILTVDWLSEALQVLKADRSHYLMRDRLLQGLVTVLLMVGVWVSISEFWRNTPIAMVFLPVNDKALAQPFILCTQGQRQYAQAINQKSSVPLVPVETSIAWRASIGKSTSIDSYLSDQLGFKGYYLAVIIVSEQSPASFDTARLDNSSESLRVLPGQTYEGWIKLNAQVETNALLILAQRHAPFDSHTLRKQFQQQFWASSKPLDIDAASDFVSTLAPGALIYPFVSVQEASPCTV